MDIEYKITSDGQLIIKQARPWASYWSELQSNSTSISELPEVTMNYYPNPVNDFLNIQCDCDLIGVKFTNSLGQIVLKQTTNPRNENKVISTKDLPKGLLIMTGVGENGEIFFSKKIIKK